MPPMPPMPPPPPRGMPPPAFFFGTSATMASVVISSAATEAAFWIATRTTLVGSMMPLATRLPRSEEHTSELQSPDHLVSRLLREKKQNTDPSKITTMIHYIKNCGGSVIHI